MKIIIRIMLLQFVLASYGQKVKSNDAIRISEHYIKEAVGERLFSYFNFSSPNGSFYVMEKNRIGYTASKSLSPNKRIKKNFTEIWVHWNFNFPEIKGVRSGLWVKLDKDLKLLEPIELEYIPLFLWNNEPSNFIGIEKVKEIADTKITKPNYGTDAPVLNFDSKAKLYVYEIWNKITESIDDDGKKHGALEIMKIDALSGEVLEKASGYYGKFLIR